MKHQLGCTSLSGAIHVHNQQQKETLTVASRLLNPGLFPLVCVFYMCKATNLTFVCTHLFVWNILCVVTFAEMMAGLSWKCDLNPSDTFTWINKR